MKKILAVFSTFVGLIFLVLITFIINFFVVSKEFNNKRVSIEKGQNVNEIYDQFGIKYTILDKIYFKLTGQGLKIKRGYYNFNGNYSKYEIINKLVSNEIETIKLTIPEGFTQAQVIERMEKLGIGTRDEIESILKNKEFPYPHTATNFEGYFYPSTYLFSNGITAKEAIDEILNEFIKKYPVSKYKDKDKFYKNLILASIVEKEVLNKEDKKLVAGVFIKRLEIGMRLESDATLKYDIGRNATKADLQTSISKYNTYKNAGLPPTPVSNPAKDTYEAVENPVVTDNLFFFMYKNKTYYSKTHEEHLLKRRESGQLK